ncbi:hypothetical protein CAPN010_15440 [Capnocytophaga cynodegmi]|uniref:hypothetical protein n=1 Tax=Capnocytophaga cynodegmi TaxID=28189 RepID=UPI001EE20E22|nr:hypothetical protein [Capnocytophaga cynodegmi]GJQ07386.1 hypothetical protein CAPN010_15440 [Capnocytophaga cynodegmi]
MTDFSYIKTLFNIKGENGFSAEELQKTQDISSNIPKVLYDYYLQLGKIEELNHTQDQLLLPNKLKWSESGDYLIFYVENQWVCTWAIRKEDLTAENPPVYMSYDQENWKKETEKLTDFLNAMASLQAVFALPFSSEEFSFLNKEELEIIKQNFQQKPFHLSEWLGATFYANSDNEIIAVFQNEKYYDVIYSSYSKENFEKIDSIIGNLGEK